MHRAWEGRWNVSAKHTALAVADQLIRLSRDDETPITPMQVQKLAYFCHAWMLGFGQGPLFQDAIECWQYGPVIRSIYHELKHYGAAQITQPILERPDQFSPNEELIIGAVWRQYGRINGVRLSQMTHADGSPWSQVYEQDKRSQIIHNHVIRDYYAKLINKAPDG